MSRNIYRKLNTLDFSDENLAIIINNLTNNSLPSTFASYKKKRYEQLFSTDFKLENGYLIYIPLNLKVIPNSEIESTLKDIYNDPNQGIGLGIQSFYNKINSQFLNIRRKDVSEFLKNQSVYQMNKQEPRPINKPIIGKYPNHRWAIDLIDMSKYAGHNNQNHWILTCIDYFSKKVSAVPLRNKEDDTTLQGLEKIVHEQNGGVYPKMLQSDNGTEFKNKIFQDWARQHDVKLINTMTYTPTGNALVENFNKYLRKMINEGYIRYNSFNWVDHLNEYLNNRNGMKHSVTKRKPIDIWEASRNTDEFDDDEEIQEIKSKLISKASKDVKRVKNNKFSVGEHVRATMTSLYSEQRKIEKQGHGKLLPVKYSPQVFIVAEIIAPDKNKDFANEEYTLKYPNGNYLKIDSTEPKRFFGTDLQKVKPNQEQILSQQQGINLNKLGVDALNEEESEQKKEKAEVARLRAHNRREEEKREQEQYVENPRRSNRSTKGINKNLHMDI